MVEARASEPGAGRAGLHARNNGGRGWHVGADLFRFPLTNMGAADTLLANYWRVVSKDGGRKAAVTGPFERAASRGRSVPRRLPGPGGVRLFLAVVANSGNTANPPASLPTSRGRPASGRSTLRTEVNLHPRVIGPTMVPSLVATWRSERRWIGGRRLSGLRPPCPCLATWRGVGY